MELLILLILILILAAISTWIKAINHKKRNGKQSTKVRIDRVRDPGSNKLNYSHKGLRERKLFKPELYPVKTKPGYMNIKGFAFEIPKEDWKLGSISDLDKRLKIILIEKGTFPPLLIYMGVNGNITFIPGHFAVYNELTDEFHVFSPVEFKNKFIPN